jgi:hypothetical protein
MLLSIDVNVTNLEQGIVKPYSERVIEIVQAEIAQVTGFESSPRGVVTIPRGVNLLKLTVLP